MSPLVGVVLAAGRGTRLRPLTLERPKALCQVGGRPLLDHALDRLRPHCAAAVLNAHHHAQQVVDHVAERSDDWARVHVESGATALGTAGGLAAMAPAIGGDDVLLTNADAWFSRGAAALDALVTGWDRRRVRLAVRFVGGRADFGSWRYVGACLLPGDGVAALAVEPSGLYEVWWREAWAAGDLELVPVRGVVVDCGTPTDLERANLLAAVGSEGSAGTPRSAAPF